MLFLTCAEILSGYVYDTVGIYIEGYFDLGDTTGSGSDTVKSECTDRLVILGKFTFTL